MFNLHYRLERKTIGLALGIIVVAAIGGAVEIIPLFTINQTVEDAPDMRVYTPLEIAGRNIYIREGCYACHSQMIRTLARRSRALRALFARRRIRNTIIRCCGDRSGPGRISRAWATNIRTNGMSRHLNNPRDVVPESVMPHYSWLGRTELRYRRPRRSSGRASQGRRALHRRHDRQRARPMPTDRRRPIRPSPKG